MSTMSRLLIRARAYDQVNEGAWVKISCDFWSINCIGSVPFLLHRVGVSQHSSVIAMEGLASSSGLIWIVAHNEPSFV